jgi:hypothetical protein
MGSGGKLYVPSCMTIGSGIKVSLFLLQQQSGSKVGIIDRRDL